MSAVPQSSLPADLPKGAQWLDLPTAAQRLGRNIRHVARLCRSTWANAGLARLQEVPGKKASWFVHESADPALSRVKAVEQLSREFDLSPFTDDQRAQIIAKEQILFEWQQRQSQAIAAGRSKQLASEDFLIELRLRVLPIKAPSLRTLQLWQASYLLEGRKALVDPRWKKAADAPEEFALFFAELKHWYLDQHEPAVKSCFKLARAQAVKHGWAISSYRSACRYLASLPRGQVTRARGGDEEFSNKVASYIQRDYTRIVVDRVERPMESNDIWCADHHLCDTIVEFNGKLVRPWLTAWEDLRSRKIIGYRFFPVSPDSGSVLLALAAGIRAAGMCAPAYCYTDNGKDFDAWFLQGQTKLERRKVAGELKWVRTKIKVEHDKALFGGVYGALQIGVWHAIPYNAKGKPVERFFGTFEGQFGKLTPTYTGSNPEEKPEWLSDRLKAGKAPSFDDYVASATAWIEEVYHEQGHEGQGMEGQSPNFVYAENLLTRRITTPDKLELCLLKSKKPVKVGRNGVTLFGQLYGQADPALQSLFGQEVYLRWDPADITTLHVVSLKGAHLCTVRANQLLPFGALSEERYREAVVRPIARHNRAMKQVAKRGMRMHLDPVDLLIEDQKAQNAAAGNPQPERPTPALKPLQIPFEAPAKPQSLPLKKCVGATDFDLLAAADHIELDAPGAEPPPFNFLDALGADDE